MVARSGGGVPAIAIQHEMQQAVVETGHEIEKRATSLLAANTELLLASIGWGDAQTTLATSPYSSCVPKEEAGGNACRQNVSSRRVRDGVSRI